MDCAIPTPVYGHFGGDSQGSGASLRDLFPRVTSQQIFKALSKAFAHQEEQQVMIEFERQKISYRANLQLFAMGHHVMGLVTDHLLRCRAVPRAVERRSQFSLEKAILFLALMDQEKKVVMAFGPGHSNRQMAAFLGLFERMIQFHMYNLLHKLQLPSRAHLAHLRLSESDIPSP